MIGMGFDSGGTHTTFALHGAGGPEWPDGNECSDSISNARGEKSMRAAADWITERIERRDEKEVCAWIGAAGFSGASAPAFTELFERAVHRLRGSGKRVYLFIANDAVSILKAPPLYGRGVAAIIGTGSVVMGAHPDCKTGLVKRGGAEWLVSDEGSGVWMTLQCIRLLLADIYAQGSENYHSPLLDRLCEHFAVDDDLIDKLPAPYRALAKAEMLARTVAEGRTESKRRLAGFVHPNLFALAEISPGRSHDRIAAQVLDLSVEAIAKHVDDVSSILAAVTANNPNDRERLPLVVGGNIAKNDVYANRLRPTVTSTCDFIRSIDTVGDAAGLYAELAWLYLNASGREQDAITAPFDPLHPVLRLM